MFIDLIYIPEASSWDAIVGSMTDINEGFAATCCGVNTVGVATGVVWVEDADTAEKKPCTWLELHRPGV